MRAAVGITTYNRPKFAGKCLRAAEAALSPLSVPLSVYNDGSDAKYGAEYRRAYSRSEGAVIFDVPENVGVARAKNHLLRWMLDTTDAKWLFLLEDDIVLTSSEAVTRYVDVAEATGLHHLSFAHHGPANAGGPVAVEGDVEFYPHSVGAWTMFSRECLEAVGLLDENMMNSMEHVEHEIRLIAAGFMPGGGPHRFPDVADSRSWLSEIPGSIENSSIRPRADWSSNIHDSLVYWRDNKPETFNVLFGDDMPLGQWARSITG